MMNFTELEKAALRNIFAETPTLSASLEAQLAQARPTNRQNTGGGFFTDIKVLDEAPVVESQRALGYSTYANLDGLDHGLGFILFMDGGRMSLLEGYAVGPESTAILNLENLCFDIVSRSSAEDGREI